jgi:hypothetical protein
MNRPLTMTAEYEKQMRIRSSFPSGQANLDNQAWIAELDATRAALDASEQTLREQCAKIAGGYRSKTPMGSYERGWNDCAEAIAAAIRSGK